MSQKYVHLHCHTQYSIFDGMITVEDLIGKTKSYGQDTVAISDHDVLTGAIEFYNKAIYAGIKPIIGCEMYVASISSRGLGAQPKYFHLVLLAKDFTGYNNLLKLVAISHQHYAVYDSLSKFINIPHEKIFHLMPCIDKNILSHFSKGLFVLSAGLKGELPYWILKDNQNEAEAALEYYQRTFGERFFLEIQETGLPDQKKVNPVLIDLGKRFGIPVVATNNCHYLNQNHCSDYDRLLSMKTGHTFRKKLKTTSGIDQLYLKSPKEMYEAFSYIPEAVAMSAEIASQCNLELPRNISNLPYHPVKIKNRLSEKQEGPANNTSWKNNFLEPIQSGFKELDYILNGGLNPGTLSIIGGRPGMGKTSFLLTLALNVARNKAPVSIFSMYYPRSSINKRLASIFAGTMLWENQNTMQNKSDMFHEALLALNKMPLSIHYTPGISVNEIEIMLNTMEEKTRPRLIVIDDFHSCIDYERTYAAELNKLAKKFQVAIIAESQLTRRVENKENKRQRLKDIRYFKSIEPYTDIICLIYRHEVYNPDKPEFKGVTEIKIAKNIRGKAGQIILMFNEESMCFET